MCAARGFCLDWSFSRYCQAAHYDAYALRDQLYSYFPALHAQEPDWNVLYAEKKAHIIRLFQEGAVQLMPGVEAFLRALSGSNLPSCVVTHSSKELVALIRSQQPALNMIPHWIMREQYTHPKPDPECYLKAIQLFAKSGDRVIGFEDTPRGLTALLGTSAQPVIITQSEYPELPDFIRRGVLHYSTFEQVLLSL